MGTDSRILGSMIMEYLGATTECQAFMLEMAKALNRRNEDAPARLKLLRSALADAPQPVGDDRYLRHLHSLTLAPTKGTVTIAGAKEVFAGYLDPNFKNWGTDKAGLDTPEVKVDVHVHEITIDGTYKELFGSLGRDPMALCLNQGQIVEFCRTHRENLHLGGYGTFFLFESSGEMFVADVRVSGGGLGADVRRLLDGPVWRAGRRRRLVVRQQTV